MTPLMSDPIPEVDEAGALFADARTQVMALRANYQQGIQATDGACDPLPPRSGLGRPTRSPLAHGELQTLSDRGRCWGQDGDYFTIRP